MSFMTTPIRCSYWVLNGKFLAGEYPRDVYESEAGEKVKALLDAGIDCFVNLTEVEEPLERYDVLVQRFVGEEKVALRRFPIEDLSVPQSFEQTKEILDFIDWKLNLQHKIYLHCWGGVGRTGTIVGCWLARHGYKGEMALEQLNKLWENCPKSQITDSPETPEQKDFVRNWNE